MSRFELKYILRRDALPDFRQKLLSHGMSWDRNGESGQYRVNSLYYDSSRLDFYYHNVDGIKFRKKLRLRHYGEFENNVSARFIEIKKKHNRTISKSRLVVPEKLSGHTLRHFLIEKGFPDAVDGSKKQSVLFLMNFYKLRPVVYTFYTRVAFQSRRGDRLRVTFDYDLEGLQWRQGEIKDDKSLSILPLDLCIVECKGDIRLPYWLSDLIRYFDLRRQRMSKYCAAIRHCVPRN